MSERITFAVIAFLGAGFLSGIIGGFILAAQGTPIPGELIAATSSAGGGLTALLVRPPVAVTGERDTSTRPADRSRPDRRDG